MDRNNWYFRQRVTDAEMIQFNDFIENADNRLVIDLLGSGLLKGGKIFENAPVDNTNVLVDQRIAYDTLGRRVAIQDLFGDTISSVVRGLTLQTDGIAVPSTVGTYLLFTKQPSAQPFTLVGQKIKIARSKFSGNNGEFTIQQVVSTTWGGLIPNQIMVRIDEELDEDGYESSLSPRGTTSIARVDSTNQSIANAVTNELGNDVKPVNPGNERIVSLYARFDRNEFDTRLDGNAQLVDFVSLETFKFVIDDSEPEAAIGNALTPVLRTNGDVFLADIRLENGANILQADIDTSRQTLITSLPAAALKIFELANAKVHGNKITWSGTNLSVDADLKIAIPNKAFLYTVPTFNIALADGEVAYVILDRTAVADPSPIIQKAARGSVPNGDEESLILVLADRNGTKLQGADGGEMQPGETRDVGDSIGEAYLSFTGMSDENDATPTYANSRLAAIPSLEAADDKLADDLDALTGQANDDRNLKLIGGGTWYWDQANNQLTISADAYVQFPGFVNDRNRIPTSVNPITLADGDVAYAIINRTTDAPTDLAVAVVNIGAFASGDNNLIIARRVGNDVIIGNGTVALKPGERIELDFVLAEVNRFLRRLELKSVPGNPKRVQITVPESDLLDGSKVGQVINQLMLDPLFSAQIDPVTGNVFKGDGVTPLTGVNPLFTAPTVAASQFRWFGVSVIPFQVNSKGQMEGSLLILPATADGASADAATREGAVLAGDIPVGWFYVQRNVGDTDIEDITQANIVRAPSSSGGSGSGNANDLLTDLKRRAAFNFMRHLFPNVFETEQTTELDLPNTTAVFSFASKAVAFQSGEKITSKNHIFDEFLNAKVDLPEIELYARWKSGKTDLAATYKVTRSGVADPTKFQTVTMTRIGETNTFRGVLKFAPETVKDVLNELAVAAEDSEIALEDATNNEKFSQEFTTGSVLEIAEKLTLYVNKVGSPLGNYRVKVVADNAGDPSLDPDDIIYTGSYKSIAALAAGDQTIVENIPSTIIDPAKKYHWFIETDDAYKASFSTGVDELRLRSDASAPAIAGKFYNGTVWATTGEQFIYTLEGRTHDLRVEITAGTNDVELEGYGLYWRRKAVTTQTQMPFQFFTIDGDANENQFDVTAFNVHPLLAKIYDVDGGQVWRPGGQAVEVIGNTLKFPTNWFNRPGELITIMIEQFNGGIFDSSDLNALLLGENHLASEDPSVNKGLAGRGIRLKRLTDAVIRELRFDDSDVLELLDLNQNVVAQYMDLSPNVLQNSGLAFFQRSTSNSIPTGSPIYQNPDRILYTRGGTSTAGIGSRRSTNTLLIDDNPLIKAKYAMALEGITKNAGEATFTFEQRVESIFADVLAGGKASFGLVTDGPWTSVQLLIAYPDTTIDDFSGTTTFYNQEKTFTSNGNPQLVKFEDIDIDLIGRRGLQVQWVFKWNTGSVEGSTDAYFTQIGLNKGRALAPWQYHGGDYIADLEACQRYYEKSYGIDVQPGAISSSGCFAWQSNTSGIANVTRSLLTRKRVTPLITLYSTATGAAGNVSRSTNGDLAIGSSFTGESAFSVDITGAVTPAERYTAHFVAEAEL